MSYFKSALDRRLLDSLWNKYWVNTLSSSGLLTNADYTTGQIFDLSEKLEQSESALGKTIIFLNDLLIEFLYFTRVKELPEFHALSILFITFTYISTQTFIFINSLVKISLQS